MSKIEIDGCLHNLHPFYDLNATNQNGQTINIVNGI